MLADFGAGAVAALKDGLLEPQRREDRAVALGHAVGKGAFSGFDVARQ